MDELVLRGIAKWPDVPAVYGWLALDRRGNWLIKGERIGNPLVVAFIGRNYASDDRGCWFFQNGPQRVFVDLEYAPHVLRAANGGGDRAAFETHGGRRVQRVRSAWIDENGVLLLVTEHGAGTVHDHDLDVLATAFVDADGNPLDEDTLDSRSALAQQGKATDLWLRVREEAVRVGSLSSADAPNRFGYVARPQAPAGEEVCR